MENMNNFEPGELNLNIIVENSMKAIKQITGNLDHLNIAVLGKAGVGKSTLLNSVFRGELAKTGIGRPVTQNIKKFSKEGLPFTIFDTPGLELGEEQQKRVKSELIDIIEENAANFDDAIHCIWYCVSALGSRIEDAELALIRELTGETSNYNIPVIIVLTQSLNPENVRALGTEIEKEKLDVAAIVPVLAQDYPVDEEYTKKAKGLEHLIEVMMDVLPERLQLTLQNLQKVSLRSKKNTLLLSLLQLLVQLQR